SPLSRSRAGFDSAEVEKSADELGLDVGALGTDREGGGVSGGNPHLAAEGQEGSPHDDGLGDAGLGIGGVVDVVGETVVVTVAGGGRRGFEFDAHRVTSTR